MHRSVTTRLRRVFGLLTLLLAVGLVTLATPISKARAQDGDDKAAETAKAPSVGEPTGPAPSMLKHLVKSAGWTFGIIILAISISLVALIVLLAMDLRMNSAI